MIRQRTVGGRAGVRIQIGKQAGGGKHQGYVIVMERLETLPVESLTAEEVAALVYLREEEKLARDVYEAFAEKWGSKVFTNIAAAEQLLALAEQAEERADHARRLRYLMARLNLTRLAPVNLQTEHAYFERLCGKLAQP